uniref:Pleckstrin homology domain-containing family A member 8 n=1 Tax=Schistocephalus solidus TaxID=70667 RepID=A0A0X3PWP4_SCHSO
MKSTATSHLPSFSPLEQAIAEKRSELRVYRDLLFQQINDLKRTLHEREDDTSIKSKDVEETTDNLKATCDTFLATSDELIRLLTSHGPSSLSAAVAKRTKPTSGGPTSDGPQFTPDIQTQKPLIPSNLQTTPVQFNGNSVFPDQDARLELGNVQTSTMPSSTTKTANSERKLSSRKNSLSDDTHTANRLSNGTLINAQMRSLRLTRPFQTFFSVMEFSFEDIPSTVTCDRLRAVEFLASSRGLLKFFNILATSDETGQPVLSRLGSLQTVYADVMGNIVRLELAVRTLCEEKIPLSKNASKNTKHPSVNLKSLDISLQDIISAEMQAGRCRNIGSAYFAMLWLCRALNFATDFIAGLFADYTTAGEPTGTSVTTHVQTAATNAYVRTLRPFHDWTLRNTAMVIIQSIPTFEQIKSILLLIDNTAPSAALMQPSAEALAQLQLDADRYALALKRCLQVVHSMFLQLELEPIFCPASAATEADLKANPPVS